MYFAARVLYMIILDNYFKLRCSEPLKVRGSQLGKFENLTQEARYKGVEVIKDYTRRHPAN